MHEDTQNSGLMTWAFISVAVVFCGGAAWFLMDDDSDESAAAIEMPAPVTLMPAAAPGCSLPSLVAG